MFKWAANVYSLVGLSKAFDILQILIKYYCLYVKYYASFKEILINENKVLSCMDLPRNCTP
jgi:hypothetical protein